MTQLFLVGACYLDTILSVPHYPEEDSKLRATSLTTRRGGNCPNTLHVLSQLLTVPTTPPRPYVSTHLISPLPDRSSPATAKIKASFTTKREDVRQECGDAGAGIGFGGCIYREGVEEPASSFVIRSEATGSRTIVNYNGLEEMSLEEFKGVVEGANVDKFESWWHFEGRIPETTLQCIQHLRQVLPKATISVEVEKPGREGLVELANAADVVFYSRGWAENRGHNDAETCLKKETPPTSSLALCTWGSRGAAAYSPREGGLVACPVPKADGRDVEVVDSIGAGDTFIAGMLYGLLRHPTDWDTRAKLSFAVGLASLKVQREGFEGLGLDALRSRG